MKKINVFIIIILLVFYSMSGIKVEASNPYDIETSPDTVFLKLVNGKPGDRFIKTLTIQNRGEKDFTYYTEARFKGGSEKLYNEFQLKVSDAEKLLFNGYLKDLKSLQPRFLPSKMQEDLKFEVFFPLELGNEYQGLQFDFELKFMVEGKSNHPDPEDPENPTPTNPDPEDPENPTPTDPDPEDPENPTPTDPDPEDSENPTPTNPDSKDPMNPEPENSDEPNTPSPDEDTLKPLRPIPEEELAEPVKEGQILPSTSTNIFNQLLIGIFLIILAGAIFAWRKISHRTVWRS